MEAQDVTPAQGKLFDLDSPLHGNVRGERSIMDFPLFSLAKRPQMEPVTYDMDGIKIEIKPSSSGIATMWDKEVLIYVLSLMVQHMHRTGEATNIFKFNAHDFFRATGVHRPSKRDYERFIEALGRLQGTQIRTNIKTGTVGTKGFFSWFAEAQATTRETASGLDQLMPVRVQLCDWLVRAVSRDSRIYDYHHDYFRLGPIERRIYELAQCYCQGEEYEMPLEILQSKIGSTATIRKLKLQLKRIATEDKIPDYGIDVREIVEPGMGRDSLGRKIDRADTVVVLRSRGRPKRAQLAA